MPTIQVKAQISAQELIEAASQLDDLELEAVTDSVLMLRAERCAPHLSHVRGAGLHPPPEQEDQQ